MQMLKFGCLGSPIIARYPWHAAVLSTYSHRLRRYEFLVLSPTWSEADR